MKTHFDLKLLRTELKATENQLANLRPGVPTTVESGLHYEGFKKQLEGEVSRLKSEIEFLKLELA